MSCDNRIAGTICMGLNPKSKSSGVKVVPYPIPKVESIYSQTKVIMIMAQIIPGDKSSIGIFCYI